MSQDPDDPPNDPEGTVFSPEELDISGDRHVVELDDGRYLISPEDEAPQGADAPDPVGEPPEPATEAERDAEVIHRWIADRMEGIDSRYGFDITAVFEGQVVRQELFSNDVITTFENLLVWYAQHVGGDTPVEDVLGILLAESNTPIRLPPNVFQEIVAGYGVEPDDRVEDLAAAVRRDGGLRVPPQSEDRR